MIPPGDEIALLHRYAQRRDESAFTQIVQRYLNLVYSAAARRVGNRTLAEDVTQAVFLILAQKASSIRQGTLLSAWLLKTTRYASSNALKMEARRRKHEHAAAANNSAGACAANPSDVLVWQEISQQLDDAVLKLPSTDRQAVLMRYFENRPIAEIATSLNLTEGAIRQRLSRATEKLRKRLSRTSTSLPTAKATDLGTWLGGYVLVSAPPGLTSSTLGAATGAISTGPGFTIAKGAMTMMKLTKVKIAAAILALAAITGTGTVITIKQSVANDHPASQPAAVVANNPSSVSAVQQEEIDTLKQAVSLADQLMNRGLEAPEDDYRLRHMLSDVQLRKATTAQEKIAVLTAAISDAQAEEEDMNKRFKAGIVTYLQTLDAKVYRLSLQEKLLQIQGQ